MLTKALLNLHLWFNGSSFFNQLFAYEWYADPLKEWVNDLKPQARSLLEIGCGPGPLSAYAAQYCDRVVGIDKNKKNIALETFDM